MNVKARDAARRLFEALYAEHDEVRGEGFEARQRDFAFHLLDAADDVVALAALLAEPEKHTLDDARRVVFAYLVHANGHLMQAARLYDAFSDPFGAANAVDTSHE